MRRTTPTAIHALAAPDLLPISGRIAAAVRLLTDDGWHQGDFFRPKHTTPACRSAKCAAGALVQVRYGHPNGYSNEVDVHQMPELGFLAGFLLDTRRDGIWDKDLDHENPVTIVAAWNDAKGRDHHDFMYTLRQAFARAEAEETAGAVRLPAETQAADARVVAPAVR